jgi:DedD protein
MADSKLLTQDEMALRRRARRRLVGAVAIALTAVVVLPMVFDPEPKPLGPEVDIRIPSRDTPFVAAPAAPASPVVPVVPPAPVDNEPTPRAAEPTSPPAKPVAEPTDKLPPDEAKPRQGAPAEDKPVAAKAAKQENPGVDGKVEKKRPETAKPSAKVDAAFASKGYYLQLGAFASEGNAKQLLDKTRAAGFKASLSSANGQYRVRVGPMAEHDKALDIQAKLKAKGFSPVLLGP